MKQISVGIIGLGCIAHIRYIPAIEKSEGIAITAVCDVDPSRAEQVGNEIGVPYSSDVDDFLNNRNIDAVIITSFHTSHAELAIKALNSGKHVLIEKPIAISSEEVARIKDAQDKNSKVVFALPYNSYPYIELIKDYINQGIIGDVSEIDGHFAHLGPKHAPWFFNKEIAHWGVMADLGIYLISTYVFLFGPIARVAGYTKCMQKTRTDANGKSFEVSVEDNCTALLDWGDGKIGTIHSNWVTGVEHPDCIWDTRIAGTEGIIYLDMITPTNKVVVYSPHRALPGGISIQGKKHYYAVPELETDIDRDIIAAFISAINNQECADYHGASLELQRHVIEIIEKLYVSSEKGCSIEIESRF